MKLIVFGLTVSSSWGNGHATLWRALCAALARRGHQVTFFEHDTTYYAQHRDLHTLPYGELVLYSSWSEVASRVDRELAHADVAIITSYCPDAIAASARVFDSRVPLRVFYDLDTPVTLAELEARGAVPYVGPEGLEPFDLVLSYTGGRALEQLRAKLGARRVAALYGSVDPSVHVPAKARSSYRCDLSYLGTYARDRQAALTRLFLDPARAALSRTFLIGGAQYPHDFPWLQNVNFVWHVAPSEHAAFYGSSRLTLNITRAAMAQLGFCPSGRLFEAAACGVPIVTDSWPGLETFFTPGTELLVAREPADVLHMLTLSDAELARIAGAARQRTLATHTADTRARELEALLLEA